MKETGKLTGERIYRIALDVFFVVLFCVYPLYSHFTYYGIIDTKYAFLRLVFYAGFPVLCVLRIFLDHRVQWKRLLPLMLWLIAVLLAWWQSVEPSAAWHGYPTWYLGVESQLIFIGISFVFDELRNWRLFDLGIVVLVVEAVLIILNRGGIYFMNMDRGLGPEYRNIFLGTLGNVDWIAGWYALYFPLLFYRSLHAKNHQVLWLAACAVVSVGAVCNGSDALVLCLFLTLLLMSIHAWKAERIRRYGYVAATVFLSIFVFGIDAVSLIPGTVLVKITRSPVLVVIGFLCLWLGWKGERYLSVPWRRWAFLIAVFLVAFVVLFVVVNLVYPSWGGENSVLRFNDAWGNHRGFLWRSSLKTWLGLWTHDPMHALFGVGPDQYYYLMNDLYVDEYALYFHNVPVTNAHCEIINTLVDYGLFGCGAYVYLLAASVMRGLRSGNAAGVMLAYCVVSVCIVNVFMFQQILSSPLEFAMIGCLLVMKTGNGKAQ